jgi:hypothetical protein
MVGALTGPDRRLRTGTEAGPETDATATEAPSAAGFSYPHESQ